MQFGSLPSVKRRRFSLCYRIRQAERSGMDPWEIGPLLDKPRDRLAGPNVVFFHVLGAASSGLMLLQGVVLLDIEV